MCCPSPETTYDAISCRFARPSGKGSSRGLVLLVASKVLIESRAKAVGLGSSIFQRAARADYHGFRAQQNCRLSTRQHEFGSV